MMININQKKTKCKFKNQKSIETDILNKTLKRHKFLYKNCYYKITKEKSDKDE